VNDLPETPETEARIAKMQKDIAELKEAMKDNWHERRESFESRVRDVLQRYPKCVTIWLEIDGIRSVKEIEEDLASKGRKIPHATFWWSYRKLLEAGLIQKVAVKARSPVYSKKPWAKELRIDEFVRLTFIENDSET